MREMAAGAIIHNQPSEGKGDYTDMTTEVAMAAQRHTRAHGCADFKWPASCSEIRAADQSRCGYLMPAIVFRIRGNSVLSALPSAFLTISA